MPWLPKPCQAMHLQSENENTAFTVTSWMDSWMEWQKAARKKVCVGTKLQASDCTPYDGCLIVSSIRIHVMLICHDQMHNRCRQNNSIANSKTPCLNLMGRILHFI